MPLIPVRARRTWTPIFGLRTRPRSKPTFYFGVNEAGETDDLLDGTVVTGTEGTGQAQSLGCGKAFDGGNAEKFAADFIFVLAHL